MGVDNCEEGGAGVHRGQCTRTRGGRAKVSPVASTSQTPAPRGKVLLETQTGECTCCRLQPPHQTSTSGLSYCQLASGQQFLQTGPHIIYMYVHFLCKPVLLDTAQRRQICIILQLRLKTKVCTNLDQWFHLLTSDFQAGHGGMGNTRHM